MNLINYVISLFTKKVDTGYVMDDASYIRSLPKHENFGTNFKTIGVGETPDWRSFAPKFRWQQSTMMCTAFAMTSAVSMLNKKETGKDAILSPLELYTRSFGDASGNTVRNTEMAAKIGLYEEAQVPWFKSPVTEWGYYILQLMGEYAQLCRDRALPIENDTKKYAIKGLTSVATDRASMRRALVDSPLLAVVQVGRGYFDNIAPPPNGGSQHIVVVTRILDNNCVEVFDSLTSSANFDGFHVLGADFPILWCYGILDLPNDWHKTQSEVENDKYANALNLYGKVKNLITEDKAIKAIADTRKKNPTHASYLDRDALIYEMALAYGGYSIQDILNHISSIRRTGKGIFDFNKLK